MPKFVPLQTQHTFEDGDDADFEISRSQAGFSQTNEWRHNDSVRLYSHWLKTKGNVKVN